MAQNYEKSMINQNILLTKVHGWVFLALYTLKTTVAYRNGGLKRGYYVFDCHSPSQQDTLTL